MTFLQLVKADAGCYGAGFPKDQQCLDLGPLLVSNPSESAGTQAPRLKKLALERWEGLRGKDPWWEDRGAVHQPQELGLREGGSLVQGGTEATRRRQEWRWPQKDHRIGEEPWRREGVGGHPPQRSRCGRKVWTFPCWHWGALEGFRAGHCQGQRGRVQKERAQPARQRRTQTW